MNAPTILPIKVPLFLRGLKCWLVWRYVQKSGELKPRKVPFYPNGRIRTGKQGDEADRAALGTYEQACATYQKGGFYGIGIALLKDWGIVGLDFDNCIIEGKISPQVATLLEDTYSEISPSGNGVRGFMRGTLPSRKSSNKGYDFGFETFSDSGFVTITGDVTDECALLGNEDTCCEVTADIHALYMERFGEGSDTGSSRRVSDDPLMTYTSKVGLSIAELKALLDKLDPGCGYLEDTPTGLSWIKVGMGIHHETDGSAEGLQLFDDWSKGSKEKYPGRSQIESKWRSFSINSGVSVTARYILRHINLLKATKNGTTLLDPKDPLGCAKKFLHAKFLGDDGITLVRYTDTWYEHRGIFYETKPESEIRAMVWEYMGNSVKYGPNASLVPVSPNKSQIDGVVDALKAVAGVKDTEPPGWREGHSGPDPKDLVSLKNGLFHIPTRQLLPHTSGLFTLNTLPFECDASAECPQWHKFLDQLFPNDAEAKACLQQMFGYLLTADVSFQKIFMVIGPRRSGKGTIGRVLRELLGRENVVSPTLTSLTGTFGMQPLIGKLVALVPDARVGGQPNPLVVERLLMVSGEDDVSVDRKNKESWLGTMTARFVFLTNELLQLGDASGALSGRFVILSLKESFYGKEDRTLTSRLLQELPGIFQWAIDGLEQLTKTGYFIQPASGEEDAEELAELGSPISAFTRECCDVGYGYTVTIDELYLAWRQWCQLSGRTHPGTKSTFGKALMSVLPKLQRRHPTVDGKRARAYEGIRLKDGEVDL